MNSAWREAQRHLAGGVSSPVRAFQAVGGEPIFMRRGLGPYLWDRRGRRYIDYCMSWGAILLGHADPGVVRAIQKQAAKGTGFGTCTEYETRLAQEIKKAFPTMEKIRFTSSGTEAAMSAVRVARGFTKKNRIVKFEGCYHGHADSLLVKAGSGLATFGTPNSEGVPKSLAELTVVLPYNDPEAVRRAFKKYPDIACVIVEPVAANMGLVPARKEFLQTLRTETSRNGAVLIWDEVITGFRIVYGGAQHVYGIRPDLTVLGKIIGGGLPIGAFGGQSKIMEKLSPSGKVYQAGTLSGNPLSMAAGVMVLSRLSQNFYNNLNQKCNTFFDEAKTILRKKDRSMSLQNFGSMFTIFFMAKKPSDYREAAKSDSRAFKAYFHGLLSKGIYTPPSAFETSFISNAHTSKELDKTLEVLKRC